MTTAWILCDQYKKGSENQCIGLAQQLNVTYIIYTTKIKFWWRWLPRRWWLHPNKCLALEYQLDFRQLPDLIIASGYASAGIAAYLKKKYRIKTIYILNPHMQNSCFDWIIAPYHDDLRGPNIIPILGSLHPHRFNIKQPLPLSLQQQWQHLSTTKVALLIGGSNKYYQFDDHVIMNLAKQLRNLYNTHNISLLITFSRRTTQHQRNLLTHAVSGIPHWIWDEHSSNPYFAMLQQAHFILVTSDSVAMVSEACGTGKPVYVIRLTGRSKKFDRFYSDIVDQNHARFFMGDLNDFRPIILNETARITLQLNDWLK